MRREGTPEAGFGLLGEVQAVVDGVVVADVGGPAARVLLGRLVAAGGRPVPAEALADAVWGDEPPPTAAATLLSHVSRLRRAPGPAGGVLERRGDGYRLAATPEASAVSRANSAWTSLGTPSRTPSSTSACTPSGAACSR